MPMVCASACEQLGRFDGGFHLWPVMPSEHWRQQAQEQQQADDGGGAGGGDEAECAVCYDRPIDVGLEPCGHVAFCGECVRRLQPQRCPLCVRTSSTRARS